MLPSPGRDCHPTPFFGLDIADSLSQLPTVAADVLDDTRALAILPRRQDLNDACTLCTGASKGRVDIGHAHLDQMRRAVAIRSDALSTDIDDHNGPIDTDAHLSAVGITYPQPLLEAESSLEPGHRCPHVGIHQHRRNGHRRRRTIREHGANGKPGRLDGAQSYRS